MTLEDLRRFAVARSLLRPTTLPRALDRLGFVQADPIRSPARAQDLILRQRVKGYRAGDLERRYAALDVEEDVFVNYGFVTRRLQSLMHPRRVVGRFSGGRARQSKDLLAFVRDRGTVHPRDVDAHFARGRVTNYWGGSSSATTHHLDLLHYHGALRVVRREAGIRLYASHEHGDPPATRAERAARIDALVDVVVALYAPLPRLSLSHVIARLRYGAPQWRADLKPALTRAKARLAHARIDGVDWYWPAGERPERATVDDGVRLLAPFDPVVWDRRRFELFWGWPYRFEAYTPLAKRKLGYYALPMLWRDRVVGWANLSVRDGVLQHECRLRRGASGGRGIRDRARCGARPRSPLPGSGSRLTAMASTDEREVLSCGGREVAITNPRKVLFPEAGVTKLDLARYYLAVSDGALRAAGGRPNVLVRYPNGIGGEFFYQKRAPESRPEWIEVVSLHFPSGRTAEEVVPRDAAALVWMANLACLELHPHPVRADDLDHPDELRVDLDPVPGVEWPQIQQVAQVVHAALDDLGLIGWPKTSGSRGIHVSIRIDPPVDLRSGAPRGAGAGARGRAPGAGAGDEQVVEGRAPGRLPRLQPERQGSHGGRRLLGAAEAGRARLGAADVGRDRRLRSARLHAADDAGAVRRGRRSARRHRRSAVLARGAARAVRARTSAKASATRPGRRTIASRPASRRASPRRAPARPRRRLRSRQRSRPADAPAPSRCSRSAGRRAKEDALAGLERWKARHPDAASHLEPADVLVDAMRGRFQTWTRIRVNLQHVPEDAAAGAGSARSERGSVDRGLGEGYGCRWPAPKTFASSYGVVTSSWS